MHGPIVLVLALVVLVAGYFVDCRLRPYAPCRSCSGKGTGVGSTRRRYNLCRRCGGSGTRRRLGAGRE